MSLRCLECHGVIVNFVKDGLDDQSSNTEQSGLHFT